MPEKGVPKSRMSLFVATTAIASLFCGLAVGPANAVAPNRELLSDEVASVTEAAAEAVGIDTSMDIALTSRGGELVAQTLEGAVAISGSKDESTIISSLDNVAGTESSMILPDSSEGSLQLSEDGVGVVEPSQEDPDVAYAVHPTEAGSVRVESLITSKDAPERFDYTFPGVDRIEIYQDEEVVWLLAMDEAGDEQLIGIIDAAWAKDANGASVPTYFEAEDNVLTQVVQHRSGEFAYPVVADPSWWSNAVAWAKKK